MARAIHIAPSPEAKKMMASWMIRTPDLSCLIICLLISVPVELIGAKEHEGQTSAHHKVDVPGRSPESESSLPDQQVDHGLDDVAQDALSLITWKETENKSFYSEGKFAEAILLTEQQLAIRRRLLGNEHPRTLIFINNMGVLLSSQGRLAEAEPYYREALEVRRRVLAHEHPDTLRSISNMGSLLSSQGRLAEAEPYYCEALEGRRRVLGDDHPDTLLSFNNMGTLLSSKGRLSESEPYYRAALEGFRRVLGDEHPDTFSIMDNIGALLSSQGRLEEAEPYFRAATEGRRSKLGMEHPDTLLSMNNMGAMLQNQGKLTVAESYFRAAMEGLRRVHGDEHPLTLTSLHNLGAVLLSQGRLAEAGPFYREALEIRRRVLGDEHPDTLTSLHNMGGLLLSQGRLAEAEPYYHEALEIRRRVLGDEHPDTLISLGSMGFLLRSQGRLGEAEPYYREALARAERLRVDIAGDALARAQFAGALHLTGIASGYAQTLLGLERFVEALAVLERGRGRAGLDMFAGGRSAAEQALRASADPDRLAQYDAALAAELEAQLAFAESQARLGATPDTDKPARRDEMLEAQRTLSERTAAVFAELRGLVPAVDPMTSEQMLAALSPGEALVIWAWSSDSVIALIARDGKVAGVMLAEGKDEAEALTQTVSSVRERIATRGGAAPDVAVAAARDAAAPESLRELLEGASSVIAVTDGPLSGIPVELLLPEMPVAYAPTATIALRSRLDGDSPTLLTSSAGVIVGDPVFEGYEREGPDYPETGILLAMVADDSNAAIAGLTRGDVLLSYAEHTLASADDLGSAIGATAEAMATRGVSDEDRPVTARVWRLNEDGEGEEIEVALALGRMGVQMDQRPPADGLRSMATFDRSANEFAANATALEQIRFYGGGLSPLPNTRLEAAAIASMLGSDATLLMGNEATVPRLRAAMESSTPRVLHLATHGLLGSAERPLLASVALTTPDKSTGEDNGFITLGDIMATWGGQLQGTELVVLSACDTASAVRQGDTMMALPLGLLISGADTVVASLWKVDDKATALLMARFYSNWLGKTESGREIDGAAYAPGEALPKLAALREAQQWLRGLTREQVEAMTGSSDAVNASATRDPTPRRGRLVTTPDPDARPYDHPFYWSAFVVYGQAD